MFSLVGVPEGGGTSGGGCQTTKSVTLAAAMRMNFIFVRSYGITVSSHETSPVEKTRLIQILAS